MKHKLFILGALLLLLTVASCRQESDALYSYGQNDELRFQEANESYAGEFKLLRPSISGSKMARKSQMRNIRVC